MLVSFLASPPSSFVLVLKFIKRSKVVKKLTKELDELKNTNRTHLGQMSYGLDFSHSWFRMGLLLLRLILLYSWD